MEFLFNAVSSLAENIANGVSTFCCIVFYEPEVPESLREE